MMIHEGCVNVPVRAAPAQTSRDVVLVAKGLLVDFGSLIEALVDVAGSNVAVEGFVGKG